MIAVNMTAYPSVRKPALEAPEPVELEFARDTLAREFAPFGVNCNAIAPGNTATPMNEKIRTDPAYAAQLAGMKAATPSPTYYSAPEDIASVALFLASDESRTMHGALVVADEGISTGLG
jgi:NAD(P)-dependent dehydrogenase (short-subunit alcohol dehydrogenase family)